jgi:predicted outer membrane repeat protein
MHKLFFYIVALFAVPISVFADATVNLCLTDLQVGTSADTNLAQALQIGGRVRFACPSGTRILMTREHFIHRTTEIDGENRVTLDGQNTTNMFRAVAGDGVFTLRNIVLRNGRYLSGRPAMIWGVMEMILDHVEISNSIRPIKIEVRKITAVDSQFFSNTGTVLEAPNLEVRRSRFVGTLGSAMRASGGHVFLEGVQVAGNAASTDNASVFADCSLHIQNSQFMNVWRTKNIGGALEVSCPTIRINNSSFTNNRANVGGGLFITADTIHVELRSVTFVENQASTDGGAIAVGHSPFSTGRKVHISHGIFRTNEAQFGGAISLGMNPNNFNILEGTAVTFKGNTSKEKGGAIYGRNAGIQLARAVFVDNKATVGGSALMLENDFGRPFMLANVVVGRNQGGGAAVQGNLEGKVINSTIVSNKAIGIWSTSRVEMTNSVLSDNMSGNCRVTGATGTILDGGANVQWPRNDCPVSIPISDPQLDSFFVPALDSVLQRAGNNAVCLAQPINARDVYGQRRPRTDRCTIGAVEGDLEHLMRRVRRSDQGR